MSRDVQPVGSAPRSDGAKVFTVAAVRLGSHLRWVPDGETGPCMIWIDSPDPVFAANPAFEGTDVLLRPPPPHRRRISDCQGTRLWPAGPGDGS